MNINGCRQECEFCGNCEWSKRSDIKKVPFDTLGEYLQVVMEYRKKGFYSFRGHRDRTWKLGVGFRFRGLKPKAAEDYIARFKTRCLALPKHDHISEDDKWRWLFLAQHHGLKTKLLDWTTNPLVALYFAVENVISKKDDSQVFGAVWALKVSKDFFLTPSEAKDPDFECNQEGSVTRKRKKLWYMVNPPPIDTRIERQSGKFSYHPDIEQNVSDEETKQKRGRELVLFCIQKRNEGNINKELRRELGIMNVHHASMFPGHAGVANFMNFEFHDLEPE